MKTLHKFLLLLALAPAMVLSPALMFGQASAVAGHAADASAVDPAAPAPVATTVTITNDTTTNATMYPTWVTASSGNLPLFVSSTKFSLNPSTGKLTVAGGLVDSALTSGRVTYATTAGLLADSANLTFTDGTTTGQLILPVGAVGTPSLTFLGDTDTGLYHPGANQLGVAVNGGKMVQFDSSGINVYDGNGTLGASILGGASGGVTVTASGTNQNITLTPSGTGAVVLPVAVTSGLQLYNTADQVTNYERAEAFWAGNVFKLQVSKGGSGTARAFQFGSSFSTLKLGTNSTYAYQFDCGSTGTAGIFYGYTGATSTSTSGTNTIISITPTYNQVSGTAANTDLLINRTQTAVGSGAQLLIDAQVGSASKFSVNNVGNLTAIGSFAGMSNASTSMDLGADARATDIRSSLNTAAGSKREYWIYTAGVARWKWGVTSTAESGSDAGSNWNLLAFTDAGAAIDTPINIARVAGGAMTLTRPIVQSAKTTTYNAIATEGNGVPAIVKKTRVTAQSAANASICTYTTPASDGSYEVSANMNVTASTTLVTTLSVSYTDESNTARTMILPVTGLTGSFIALGAISGAGASVWETPVMHIRCKASTAITIFTSAGTFSSVTYTAEGCIKQID